MHVTALNEDKASVKQATARYAPALLSSPSHQPVFANGFLKAQQIEYKTTTNVLFSCSFCWGRDMITP